MNALGQRIAALIAAQGPISVAQFMTLALHDPEGGYYATRDPFGAGGDFITAPEISQMFGEMLGLWCVQVWHDQGKPETAAAGRTGAGTRHPDGRRAARRAAWCRNSWTDLEVVLVEASPVLQRDAAAKSCKDCGVPIRWAAQFDDSAGRPAAVPGRQ